MYLTVTLFLLFLLAAYNAKKQGDFGILTACLTKEHKLRLDCYYASCEPGSPPFDCEFWTDDRVLLGSNISGHHVVNETFFNITKGVCQLTFLREAEQYADKSYNCTLTRKRRREERNITINYKTSKGKNRIKDCPRNSGLPVHPAALWPVFCLPLWGLFITHRPTA